MNAGTNNEAECRFNNIAVIALIYVYSIQYNKARMASPITMETLPAAFVAAIDQLMHFRIYEAPDETKKSPRLIAFSWDEEDASFVTRSLNQCCDVSSRTEFAVQG